VKYIALLRAINVGGRVVRMDALRRHFEDLGLQGVETFIASGNVVFDSRSSNADALARRIERALNEALGYDVATFLRTDAELAAVASHKPFRATDLERAYALNVGFLAQPADAALERVVKTLRTDIDDFHVHGREIYWLCRTRQSDSRFTNVRFEKVSGRQATFRGINTVRKMAARYAGWKVPH